jgi:hypothetical protein
LRPLMLRTPLSFWRISVMNIDPISPIGRYTTCALTA